jgi:hypothetical protein
MIAPGSFAHVRASAKIALGDFVHVLRYGDSMFLAPRRRFTAAAVKLQPVFTYFFTEIVPGYSPELGRCAYTVSMRI